MRRVDDVLTQMDSLIDQHILEDFIARGWVRPMRDETDYVFDEVDIARIRLVCELHIEMKFEFDAVDIILSLMDQLYEAKACHSRLAQALEKQPKDVRKAVIESLQKAS
jgi:chaperone modulatory protein CbpM